MTEKIKPMVLFQKRIWFWCFLIRVDGENFRESVGFINRQWDEMFPDYPFAYDLVDDLYEGNYKREMVQGRILRGKRAMIKLCAASNFPLKKQMWQSGSWLIRK